MTRHRTGWIIGGVALLLLLGVAGVVTLVALDSNPSSGPEEVQPTAGSPTPGQAQFGPVPDLCDVDDHFAPIFDLVPPSELADDNERDGDSLYQRSCVFQLDDGSSLGFLRVHAAVYGSPQRARNGYRGTSGPAAGLSETQAEIDANWEEGVVLLDEESRGATVQLVLLDGTLVQNLECYILGDAYDIAAQQAGLLQVAYNIREAMRQ